jgi:hypothetical protein
MSTAHTTLLLLDHYCDQIVTIPMTSSLMLPTLSPLQEGASCLLPVKYQNVTLYDCVGYNHSLPGPNRTVAPYCFTSTQGERCRFALGERTLQVVTGAGTQPADAWMQPSVWEGGGQHLTPARGDACGRAYVCKCCKHHG